MKDKIHELFKIHLDNSLFIDSEIVNKTIWLIKEIAGPYYPFTPQEKPFSYLEIVLEPEVEMILRELVKSNIDMLLKAKILDFLWVIKKDYHSAVKAYELYCICIQSSNDFEKIYYLFNRIVSIYLAIGAKTIDCNILNETLEYIINQGKDNQDARFCIVIETALENSLYDIDKLIDLANEKTEQINEKLAISIDERYYDLLERLYAKKYNIRLNAKPTKNKDIEGIRRKKVELYVQTADKFGYKKPQNAFQYIHFMKKAVNLLKGIYGTENERIELLKEIDKAEKNSINTLPIISHSVDISDAVQMIIEDLNILDKEESLCYFVYSIELISKEYMEKEAIDNVNKYPLSNLFPKALLDKNGKCKAHLPYINQNASAYENNSALQAKIENDCIMRYDIYGKAQISNILHLILEKYCIDEKDVRNIVEQSAFVPESRRKAFTLGLLAGFNLDYITALSILIPQVENAIRELAIDCGDVVYNIKEDGIEELKTLNAMLDLPNLSESLDENLLFNFKNIFCSKYCYNMRNEVAHGTLDDNDFNMVNAMYTWWFVFRVCYMFTNEIEYKNVEKIMAKRKANMRGID